MKNFFRKLFFADDPAAGMIFGFLLNLIAGFTFFNLACLWDTFYITTHCGYEHSGTAWLICALITIILQIFILLYWAVLSWRFYFKLDKVRYKLIFWLLIALQIAFIFIFNSEKLFMLASGLLFFAGANALCIRKHNCWWYILVVVAYGLLVPAFIILDNASQVFEVFDCHSSLADRVALPPVWRVVLVYSSVVLFGFWVFCNIKLWASAYNRKLRVVWGIGCTILIFIFVLTYLVTLGFALYQQKQCKLAFAALEKNFQREFTAQALEKQYYANRKADEKFHKDLKKALDEFVKNDKDLHQIMGEQSLTDLPEEYQQKFFSEKAEKIGSFFDKPLPAREREYKSGSLFSLLLPELQVMREAARFFAWQMKIASLQKDRKAALLAWRRSANIVEYLEHDTLLISSLVLIAVERIRQYGLEYMLAADFLSDDDLLLIQKELEMSAAKVPQRNRNALYTESVFGIDFLQGLVKGFINDAVKEGVYDYRFLAPGLWYLGCCNYYELVRVYNNKNLCHVNDKVENSPRKILVGMLIPALNTAGKRMHEMEMCYAVFNALIEAVKIKRTAGKYPEKLPLNKMDYFTGNPLQYKTGDFEFEETYLVKRDYYDEVIECKYEIKRRIKKAKGVIVWSVGRDKIDAKGFNGRYGDRRGDDHSAKLVLP